jgi:AcrR family transcriptional regulator
MGRRPAANARDHILDTAARLFDAHGVHAVGLQQIIDECSCGKSSLYREFASKDDLVVAYLRRCVDDWDCRVATAIEPFGDDPAAQLLAIVRSTAEKAHGSPTRGCPLRNTLAEFPEADHPANRLAVAYFDGVRSTLREIARKTEAADPDTLGDRIMLIIDGLYVNGATLGPNGASSAAVDFAEDVIAAATR